MAKRVRTEKPKTRIKVGEDLLNATPKVETSRKGSKHFLVVTIPISGVPVDELQDGDKVKERDFRNNKDIFKDTGGRKFVKIERNSDATSTLNITVDIDSKIPGTLD